jgi:uncharacterized protein DUF4440
VVDEYCSLELIVGSGLFHSVPKYGLFWGPSPARKFALLQGTWRCVAQTSGILTGYTPSRMSSNSHQSGREEIRLLLKQINDAWLKGPPAKIPQALDQCFADDVVIKGSDFKEVGRGKAACIKSYQDFVEQAHIFHCSISEPEIDIVGTTATATYSWDMIYSMNSKRYHETGHELFVFSRVGDRWLVVWRAMFPETKLEQLQAIRR